MVLPVARTFRALEHRNYTLAFAGVAPLGNLAACALAGSVGAPLTFLIDGLVAALAAFW